MNKQSIKNKDVMPYYSFFYPYIEKPEKHYISIIKKEISSSNFNFKDLKIKQCNYISKNCCILEQYNSSIIFKKFVNGKMYATKFKNIYNKKDYDIFMLTLDYLID
jgi:hypothetical protein